MSHEESSEIAYVEYYPTNTSDQNQFYIQVHQQSPISVQTTPRTNNASTHFYTGSTLDNTPDSVRGGSSPNVNTTPVRKIAPARTYLEDVLQVKKNYLDESLSLASPYVLTPDKESDRQLSPDRMAARHHLLLQDSGKRGRPRADVINSLIIEGSQSGSGIKCKICYRYNLYVLCLLILLILMTGFHKKISFLHGFILQQYLPNII